MGRKKDAEAWNHVQGLAEKSAAVWFGCKYCTTTFAKKTSSSSILRHVKTQHAKKLSEQSSQTIPTMLKEGCVMRVRFSDVSRKQMSVEKRKALDEAVCKWLIYQGLPFHCCRATELRAMLALAGSPSYKLPTPLRLQKLRRELIATQRTSISSILDSTCQSACVSVDGVYPTVIVLI
jgi:hypothetical protein